MSSHEPRPQRTFPMWVIPLFCLTAIILGVGLAKLLSSSSRVSPELQQLGMLVVAVEAIAYAFIAVLLGARRLMTMIFAAAVGILCRAAMAGGGVLVLGKSGPALIAGLQAAWLGDATLFAVHGALAVLCLAFLRPILLPSAPVPAEAEAFGPLQPDVSESLADFQTSVAAPEGAVEPEASREQLVSELMGPLPETTDAVGVEAPGEPLPVTYVEETPGAAEPSVVEEPTPSYAPPEPVAETGIEEPALSYTPPEPVVEQPQEQPVETPIPPYPDEPVAAPAPPVEVAEEQPTPTEGPLFSFEMEDAPREPAEHPEPVLRVTSEGVETVAAEAEEPSAEPALAEGPPTHVEAPSRPAPAPAVPDAAAAEAAAVSGEVTVSAETVLAQFPEGALNLAPDELEEAFVEKRFAVPLDVVVPQLHEGEVRVPARIIVEQLPRDSLAVSEVELDAALADGIELALGEIVPQIPGEHLALSPAAGAPPELPTEDIFEVPVVGDFDALVAGGETAEPAEPSVVAEEPEAAAPAESPPSPAPEPVVPGETISVGAQAVLGQLPPDAFVSSADQVHESLSEPTFRIPTDMVMPQLSSGQVVVPTSLIASQLPPGLLAMGPEDIDANLPAGGIELPLSQVVEQVQEHIGPTRGQEPAPVIDEEPLFAPAEPEGPAAITDSSAVVTPSVPSETSEPVVPAEPPAEPPEPAPVEAAFPEPWETVAEAPVAGAEEETTEAAAPAESMEAPAEPEPTEAAPRAPWEAAIEPEPVAPETFAVGAEEETAEAAAPAEPEPVEAVPPPSWEAVVPDEEVGAAVSTEAAEEAEEPAAPEQEPAIAAAEKEHAEAEVPEPEAVPVAEEAPAAAPADVGAAVPAAGPEPAPAMAAGAAEALAVIDAAAGSLGVSQTNWVELPSGIYLATALPGGAEIERASEVAAEVLTAGRELCDASERGGLSAVLISARMGSGALRLGITAGGAAVACQLAGVGIRSPGKAGAAAHKLMTALQSMSLPGGELTQGSLTVSEEWIASEGDSNGAEEAQQAAAAVKPAGVGSQLFVRSDGPRMILLGPPALLADACVSAAGKLLDKVADYAASIGLGEVEKVIVEGAAGSAALVPAQDGIPALVLLGPGSVKAGMVSVQIGKAAAALTG